MKENKLSMRVLGTLFLTFLKIGAFTFGGGYAMLALLEDEFVSKRKWIEKEDFLDMIALGEATPGPIAINSATFIGYKRAGAIGSLVSTCGVIIPSIVIIYCISLFFERFLEFKYVGYAFVGIKACVVYLIMSAGIKMFKGLKHSLFCYIIFGITLCTFVAFTFFDVSFSAVFYIFISGAVGIATYLIGFIRERRVK